MGETYVVFKKGLAFKKIMRRLSIKQMGFFNKKTGENHLVKMSESVNKRVLRLLVKQMGVIGGIADDLPVKEEPMMCNKMCCLLITSLDVSYSL